MSDVWYSSSFPKSNKFQEIVRKYVQAVLTLDWFLREIINIKFKSENVENQNHTL